MYFTLGTNVDMKGIAMTGTKGQWFISDDTKKEYIFDVNDEIANGDIMNKRMMDNKTIVN